MQQHPLTPEQEDRFIMQQHIEEDTCVRDQTVRINQFIKTSDKFTVLASKPAEKLTSSYKLRYSIQYRGVVIDLTVYTLEDQATMTNQHGEEYKFGTPSDFMDGLKELYYDIAERGHAEQMGMIKKRMASGDDSVEPEVDTPTPTRTHKWAGMSGAEMRANHRTSNNLYDPYR